MELPEPTEALESQFDAEVPFPWLWGRYGSFPRCVNYRRTNALGQIVAENPPQFSCSVWIKPKDSASLPESQTLLCHHHPTGGWHLQLQYDTALFVVSTGASAEGTVGPLNDTWHHYCGVIEGSRVLLYVDGKLVGEDALPEEDQVEELQFTPDDATQDIKIGPFKGFIAEATVWQSDALTKTQVASLAGRPRPALGKPVRGMKIKYPITSTETAHGIAYEDPTH